MTSRHNSGLFKFILIINDLYHQLVEGACISEDEVHVKIVYIQNFIPGISCREIFLNSTE